MPRRIKVLIVEDHNVVREGLKILIGADPELEIAGEAQDGEKAVNLARDLRPDVVLMDLAMPRSNGLKATQTISHEMPETRVLVLSASTDEDSVRHAMEQGASGYLTKHSAAEELLRAIREVRSGKHFYSANIAARLRHRAQAAFIRGNAPARSEELTRRELEVLKLIASGRSNKEIGSDLGISIKTVEKHRQQIMHKLDLHEVAGLTRYAVSKGIVHLSPTPSQTTTRPVSLGL